MAVIAIMGVGKAYHDEGGTVEELNNITSELDWDELLNESFRYYNSNITLSDGSFSDISIDRLLNVVYRVVDTLGFMLFEGSKWGIEYGYTHPNTDYMGIARLMIICCWVLLAVSLVPVLIILLAIGYWAYQAGKKKKEEK